MYLPTTTRTHPPHHKTYTPNTPQHIHAHHTTTHRRPPHHNTHTPTTTHIRPPHPNTYTRPPQTSPRPHKRQPYTRPPQTPIYAISYQLHHLAITHIKVHNKHRRARTHANYIRAHRNTLPIHQLSLAPPSGHTHNSAQQTPPRPHTPTTHAPTATRSLYISCHLHRLGATHIKVYYRYTVYTRLQQRTRTNIHARDIPIVVKHFTLGGANG